MAVGETMRTLLIDNTDSYTYNLFQLMARLYREPPTVLANDAADWESIDLSAYDALVVSPGPGHPGRPADVGVVPDVLVRSGLPALGVCLGHQAMGWLAGAPVERAPVPRHGYLDRIAHVGEGLFAGVPQGFVAVRYHSLALGTPLPDDIEATAWGRDGVLMGLRHRRYPWWGVQFHPESVASQHGARLLANFARLAARHHRDRGRPVARSRVYPRGAVPPAVRSTVPPAVRSTVAGQPAGGWRLEVASLPYPVDTERAFETLFGAAEYAYWLDSGGGRSRFSFLGDAGGPHGEVLTYRAGEGAVEVRDHAGDVSRVPGTIVEVLSSRLSRRALVPPPELPFDLVGGYVGYLGYELKRDRGWRTCHRADTPDAVWMAATRLVAVDHRERRTWVVALAGPGEAARAGAARWVGDTTRRLAGIDDHGRGAGRGSWAAMDRHHADGGRAGGGRADGGRVDVEPWLARDRDRYLADIMVCQDELRAGDSYEICLTDTVEVPFAGDPWHAYRRQRRLNPAPYAAFLRMGGVHVLCASPERFLRVGRDRYAESRPIKGTERRHPDPARDEMRRARLAADPKSHAENLMIVDLVRNDLGQVCEVGSVEVPELMVVESYATVHQLVSAVRGRLRPDVDAVAAAWACFPGGSMTGAPKVRTMEIIDRLEDRARGVYSGTLGYFGLNGTADLNIVIRTAVVRDGRASIGAGGAIVLDSDPAAEYDEMILKAAAGACAFERVPAGDLRAGPVGHT